MAKYRVWLDNGKIRNVEADKSQMSEDGRFLKFMKTLPEGGEKLVRAIEVHAVREYAED